MGVDFISLVFGAVMALSLLQQSDQSGPARQALECQTIETRSCLASHVRRSDLSPIDRPARLNTVSCELALCGEPPSSRLMQTPVVGLSCWVGEAQTPTAALRASPLKTSMHSKLARPAGQSRP